MVMTRNDVTDMMREQQRQQELLKNALRQAEDANNAKTNFLSKMSHEIRTPMNAIVGLTTLAQRAESQPAQVAEYLAKKGRRIIGWDEILEGGVPASASVMSWRGAKGGINAATAGHDVVMTPNTYCYFDYGQFKEGDKYEYIGGMLPLEKVYGFDPCEGIPKEQWGHVLGGQCNNWSEFTWEAADLEWKAFPRTCALAECVWTAPAKKDFAEFKARLIPHCARLKAMGINVAPVK